MYINDLIQQLLASRAPRGRAIDKAHLLEKCRRLKADIDHLSILQIDNKDSTYNGEYPKGVGHAYEKALGRVDKYEKLARKLGLI